MPEGLLEVDVRAGSGLAPMIAPPDGQHKQEHGVAHHAVVVSDCNVGQVSKSSDKVIVIPVINFELPWFLMVI